MKKTILGFTISATLLASSIVSAEPAKCLFISSYAPGYAWSDGVERGVRQELEGLCEIRQFDMDTKAKANKSPEAIERIALKAKEMIDSWKPDVVITADDNAAKYVIKAHYKDAQTPFIFCGVNWTVKEYGFPYSNVTGMIEVAPLHDLFDHARDLLDDPKTAFYLGADTTSEKKNLKRMSEVAKKRGIVLSSQLVNSTTEWLHAFKQAQDHGFVIVGSHKGIDDWNPDQVSAKVPELSKRLSLTVHGWMMPVTMLGVVKIAEEQGMWSAKSALYVLGGLAPSDIPVTPNRLSQTLTNEALLSKAGFDLSDHLAHN